MAVFSYQAIDANGKLVKGTVEGDSARSVRSTLRSQQLKPVDVVAAKEKRQKDARNFSLFSPKIKDADLSLLTRQLAILVGSNVPLDESLATTAKNSKRAHVQSLLLEVRSRVVEGYSLTKALESLPKVFDPLYIAMVNAGERSGYLGPVLERLAEHTEKRQDTKRSVKSALAYPIFLIMFTICVIVLLMVYVIPEMVGTFASAKAELPALTKMMIATSDLFINYGWLILFLVVGCWFMFRLWLKRPNSRRKWHQFLLSLPVLGELFRISDTSRFASTLSVLMSSGVPLVEGLNIASEVLSNEILKEAAGQAAVTVREGGSLRRGLENSEQFPVMMVQMVGSGEVSGELEQMLQRAAHQQERELDSVLNGSLKMLAPLIVVFMGIFVLIVVLSILMPIFQMNQLAQ